MNDSSEPYFPKSDIIIPTILFLGEKMKSSMKIMAVVGAIAVLLVAGLAMAMSTVPSVQAENQTPQVSINDQISSPSPSLMADSNITHTFTITVSANVEGKKVPIADALVLIYSVNVTKADNSTTIVLEKMGVERTDANGVVNFNLTEGKYIVIAHYHGLDGFGKVNLTDDMSRNVMLHNWHSEFLNGMEGSKRVTITMEK
jgi:hypothetical protein